ncbi:hypothetical protein FPSE5266_11223 [Fusarium pseudograminearum]|nr:hypothetical protein FPSE5266_11223 [Fusarium pseudograminearum]
MTDLSWAQRVTDRFFGDRKSPSQKQCDDVARSISSASTVSSVESPGSMSYTVICSGCPGPQQDLVLSFREQGAMLDVDIVKLAKEIHGNLVPESTFHGNMEGADPPLFIYSMPYLRGSSYTGVQPFWVELDSNVESTQRAFVKDLARYFARFLSKSILSKLIEALPSIFAKDYPQVLTHNDFSVTNILVNEDTLKVTGIVDWSLASVMPFGLDLDILFLATGFRTLHGWHDYGCKQQLQDVFWDEFWFSSGIEGEDLRHKTQNLAEVAGQIGAILRLAFRRNDDGSPSEEVLVSGHRIRQLKVWLGE